jgi:hypothetical protein
MSAPIPASSVNTTPPVYRYARSEMREFAWKTTATVLFVMNVCLVVWVLVGAARTAGVL